MRRAALLLALLVAACVGGDPIAPQAPCGRVVTDTLPVAPVSGTDTLRVTVVACFRSAS